MPSIPFHFTLVKANLLCELNISLLETMLITVLCQMEQISPPWNVFYYVFSEFFMKTFLTLFLNEMFSLWRSHRNIRRWDGEPRWETKNRNKRWQRHRQRPSQTKGTPLTFSVSIFLCTSLSPSQFFVLFFDLTSLMKQTKSDQHMLPQHSGLFLCCFLAIFNDLFNIYHS